MRRLFAILATFALLVTPPMALAGHKDGHKVPPGAAKNAPPPEDCVIEIGPICLIPE